MSIEISAIFASNYGPSLMFYVVYVAEAYGVRVCVCVCESLLELCVWYSKYVD